MREHRLTETLVPNAGEPPDVRVLVGSLGRSDRDGYWRLYLNPELTTYVEVAEDDVRHVDEIRDPQTGISADAIWVDRAASTRAVNVGRDMADFLHGEFTLGGMGTRPSPQARPLPPKPLASRLQLGCAGERVPLHTAPELKIDQRPGGESLREKCRLTHLLREA
jgi:hypothetical protein